MECELKLSTSQPLKRTMLRVFGGPGSADLLRQDVARVESLDPRESGGSAGFAKKPVKVDFEDRAYDFTWLGLLIRPKV